jgi:regulatory protein
MSGGNTLDQARNIAWRILARSDRSCKQLHVALTAKGVNKQTAEQVVAELTDRGYLDDRLYAAKLIDRCLSRKPCGPRFLLEKLLHHGVCRDLACQAVNEKMDRESERAFALALLKRLQGQGDMKPEKLQRFLINRGFSHAVARHVLEEEFGGHLDIMP